MPDLATKPLPQWFALCVKSRCEKAVAAAARCKGFEEFLPLHKCVHHWSDRLKLVDEPLFPGYVFCRLRAEERLPLLTIPGVMRFVGIGHVPVPLSEGEIWAIRDAVRSAAELKPWPFVENGNRVRLLSGPLTGVEGFLVRNDGRQRIVLGLSVLRQSVAVEIEHAWTRPAAQSATPAAF